MTLCSSTYSLTTKLVLVDSPVNSSFDSSFLPWISVDPCSLVLLSHSLALTFLLSVHFIVFYLIMDLTIHTHRLMCNSSGKYLHTQEYEMHNNPDLYYFTSIITSRLKFVSNQAWSHLI